MVHKRVSMWFRIIFGVILFPNTSFEKFRRADGVMETFGTLFTSSFFFSFSTMLLGFSACREISPEKPSGALFYNGGSSSNKFSRWVIHLNLVNIERLISLKLCSLVFKSFVPLNEDSALSIWAILDYVYDQTMGALCCYVVWLLHGCE
jgi:hypothetical protein